MKAETTPTDTSLVIEAEMATNVTTGTYPSSDDYQIVEFDLSEIDEDVYACKLLDERKNEQMFDGETVFAELGL